MNSDIIKLLPDSVANQIAAGEVIQRPASVIKELVENSIDAGATRVEIIIKDAGRTLIQVVDNGKGMSPTDARMAFERHATSKITSADDLYSLCTMGFRGEALPSIAAVAQIDLRTMTADAEVGTHLQLSESQFVGQEPCACPPGTNLMVKNLFFHMPARRKFLKKDSVEMSHIMHEFERLALVNTDVEFTLISNDVTQYKLLRGSLKQRITALMGKAIGSQIVPLSTETPLVRIDGFVGLPQNARRRGAPQFFFVNGRNMRHPYFHKAVTGCYSELIASDMQPIYFINMQVDPSTIDVNIHPQKHEIKFENEQAIWQILTAAVRQALGKVNASGGIDFDVEEFTEIPVFLPDSHASLPSIALDDSYSPFTDPAEGITPPEGLTTADYPSGNFQTMRSRGAAHVHHDWDKLYESFNSRRNGASDSTPDSWGESAAVAPESAPQPALEIAEAETHLAHLTLNGKYILLPSAEGIMVIDRYRAHVRVTYDKLSASISEGSVASQKLLFPESVELSPAQSMALSSLGEDIARLGYEVSFLGNTTWAVNATPAGIASPLETLVAIASELAETGIYDAHELMKPAMLAMARSAAVLPGQPMNEAETEMLAARLLASPDGAYTPDGNRTYFTISNDYIVKCLN